MGGRNHIFFLNHIRHIRAYKFFNPNQYGNRIKHNNTNLSLYALYGLHNYGNRIKHNAPSFYVLIYLIWFI